MGIKLAKALGNDVMAISSSAHKEALAKEKGATMFACSRVSKDFIKNVSSTDYDKTYSDEYIYGPLNWYFPMKRKNNS